jgi:hypothetical protein
VARPWEACSGVAPVRYHSRTSLLYGASRFARLQSDCSIRALKTLPNLPIKYGQFTTHSVPMYLTNVDPPQKVWVDKTEEKGSDVNLASHLLRDAYGKPRLRLSAVQQARTERLLWWSCGGVRELRGG